MQAEKQQMEDTQSCDLQNQICHCLAFYRVQNKFHSVLQ